MDSPPIFSSLFFLSNMLRLHTPLFPRSGFSLFLKLFHSPGANRNLRSMFIRSLSKGTSLIRPERYSKVSGLYFRRELQLVCSALGTKAVHQRSSFQMRGSCTTPKNTASSDHRLNKAYSLWGISELRAGYCAERSTNAMNATRAKYTTCL